MKFCPNCGKLLVFTPTDGRERPACISDGGCGFVHYGNYSIGVGGLVVRGDTVLLIQRNQDPGKGLWTIPGGYVEFDETAEVGVVREVEEETGIQTNLLGLVAFRSRVNPRNNDAYAVFLLEATGGSFIATPNEEIASVNFFGLDELQALHPLPPISLQLAQMAIRGEFQILQGQSIQRWNNANSDLVFLSRV